MKPTTTYETLVPIWVKPEVKAMILREKHKRSIENGKTVTYSTLLKEKFTKKV